MVWRMQVDGGTVHECLDLDTCHVLVGQLN